MTKKEVKKALQEMDNMIDGIMKKDAPLLKALANQ
jgi:hypothetical protein